MARVLGGQPGQQPPTLRLDRSERRTQTTGDAVADAELLIAEGEAENRGSRATLQSALGSRRVFQRDQRRNQLEARIRGSVKPRAQPPGSADQETGGLGGIGRGGEQGGLGALIGQGQGPGPNGPRGQGGKGAMEQKAKDAIAAEPDLPDNHPHVREKRDISRRLDQLGVARESDDVIHIRDNDRTHGDQIARVVGGESGLAQRAKIRVESPDDPAAFREAKRAAHEQQAARAGGDPSLSQLAERTAMDVVSAPGYLSDDIARVRGLKSMDPGTDKVFMNASYSGSVDHSATELTARMMIAEDGTKLHQQAVEHLGHEPRFEMKDGIKHLNDEDFRSLKGEVVLPELERQMAKPEVRAQEQRAQAALEHQVAEARKEGIMVFKSAGNQYKSASAVGRPDTSAPQSADAEGLFVVGSTKPNGPGTADDEISAFSSDSNPDASIGGEGIPVGIDKDGNPVDLKGTSYSTPQMTETAWQMAAANPDLSLDEIETILKDPRVARDIPGTDRDGAGTVDPFAAVLVAQHRDISADQIDEIRTTLDAHPEAQFRFDGTALHRID